MMRALVLGVSCSKQVSGLARVPHAEEHLHHLQATAASTAALDNANSTATYHTMGKQLAMSFMPFYGITGASGGKVKGHNGRGVQNLRTEEPVETFSV